MKLDELFEEQSSKPVSKATPEKVRAFTARQATTTTPAPAKAPVAAPVAFNSRAEVLAALQLLSGGSIKLSSINGGKVKAKKKK